jgi:hypothetical protein
VAWEVRKGGPGTGYYYRSVRDGDRVLKVYYGRGSAGHDAAAEQEMRRLGRVEAKRLLDAERRGSDEADRLAAELRAWGDVLFRVWMVLAGYHRHRGQWRAKRGG